MSGLTISVGLAVVVLAQLGLVGALAIQSRRQHALADSLLRSDAALAVQVAQADQRARESGNALAVLREEAALERAAQVADRERLAAVETRATLADGRLSRLHAIIDVEGARLTRLAFRLSGVSARLGLSLADAEVQSRAATAMSEALEALRCEVGASVVDHGLTQERVLEVESRQKEHTDWLARSHEPWLQAHDVRMSALEARAEAAEAASVSHERWLAESHEVWLLRHDQNLAELGDNLVALRAGLDAADRTLTQHRVWLAETYEPGRASQTALTAQHDGRLAAIEHEIETTLGPTLDGHAGVILSHGERLGSLEQGAADAAEQLAAQYLWLDQSHEPWLQRHDIALTETRSSLEGLLSRMEREEVVIGACQRWLADSHEPWLGRHDVQLAELSADLAARPTFEEINERERAMGRTLQAHLDGEIRESAGRGVASAREQSETARRLAALAAEFEAAQITLNGTVKWLGSSHEPWLRRHEAEIKRLLIELPTFTGALERELAALGQAQLDNLVLLEPLLVPGAAPRLDLARRAILESKARRRDARMRGMLPRGIPGPCEGIRLGHGRRPILVVAYSGMQDVFGWLPRLESLDVQVVHLVDTTETWYVDGCAGARSIDHMMEMTREAIAGFDYDRLVVIGQSMGGYAALRFGPELGADLIGVFGPQTHHLTQSRLQRGQFLQTPPAVIDVRPALVASRTPVHVMVSRSEDENEYVWDDHAHLEGLQDQRSVHIHVCASDDHGVSGYLSRAGKLSDVLSAFFDMVEGRTPSLDLDAL